MVVHHENSHAKHGGAMTSRQSRRRFLRHTIAVALLAGVPRGWMGSAFASDAPETVKLRCGIIALTDCSPLLQPFPGFANDYLRQKDPYWANWDISGSFRMRYEVRETHLAAPPANDFKKGVDNDNSYFSDKLLLRLGYSAKWWSALVEGRSSSATGDDRGSAPNIPTGSSPDSDGPVDLHQAYVFLGNHKEFPVSLKVGRQELSCGDERFVGAFAWNNIGRVFDAAKVRWQNAWFGMDAFTSRIVVPDDNNFNMSNEYETFSGAYFNTTKIPKNWTEFYFLARNVSPGAATLFAPATTPAHLHPDGQDTWVMLQGELTCYLGNGERRTIRAGDVDVADREQVHGAINESRLDAVFVSIYSAPKLGWVKAPP
ncbi:MAG: cupin domain-containing protein [Pedosphaera sp.]|nr:cupin domain-containing protein [Pedosphaera sp.]